MINQIKNNLKMDTEAVIAAAKKNDKAAAQVIIDRAAKKSPEFAVKLEKLMNDVLMKEAAEMLVKAKAEMQELTISELVKQNAELKAELMEFKELFHKFSASAMKNDAKHGHIIAELNSQIHELQTHCSGTDFHNDIE